MVALKSGIQSNVYRIVRPMPLILASVLAVVGCDDPIGRLTRSARSPQVAGSSPSAASGSGSPSEVGGTPTQSPAESPSPSPSPEATASIPAPSPSTPRTFSVVTTLAGGVFRDGSVNLARFHEPAGVALDTAGNLYVADSYNNRIRKIGPSGLVSTLAGQGRAGYADGPGSAAMFDHPAGVAVDGSGNVYVADERNNRIRKISPAGDVTTVAGDGTRGLPGRRLSCS